MKRTLAMLLALLLVFSMIGCGSLEQTQEQAETTAAPTESTESVADAFSDPVFQRARKYGFVPEEMWSEPDRVITMSELCGLLSNVIKSYMPEHIDDWNALSAQALSDTALVQVDDAILAMFEAVMAMDIHLNDGIGNDTNWESMSTASDWWEGASWDYSSFPNWHDVYINQNGHEIDILLGAELHWQSHLSSVDGSYAFPPEEDWTYDFSADVTYRDAIRAVTVFMESDALVLGGDCEYVSIYDAGTYDSSVITEELLNKETALPAATQSSLPASWRGIGLAARKDAARAYRDFRESDIRILADNGMNFTRLFFDFSTLQFPYKTDDREMVNLIELRELDQLIAWGMEYNVHIQIGCFGFLGFDCQGNKEFNQLSDDEWQLFQKYWCMLARRYADIPSAYLSFDLLNEWTPDEERQYPHYASVFGDIADAIWEIDADRVVVNSFRGNPDLKWVEAIAAQGIALGIHPYNPDFITNWIADVEYPADAVWPNPWFGCVMEAGDAITITGLIDGATLSIYLEGATQDAILNVYADEVLIESFDPVSSVIDEYGDYREFETPYRVHIPEDASVVTLQSSRGSRWIRFDGLRIKNEHFNFGIMPHDYRYFTDRATVNLSVDESGWKNADSLIYDGEQVYLTAIKPSVDIAEKYQVGVVVNELGLFGDEDIGEAAYAYTDDLLRTLKVHGLGWCYCEMEIGYLFDSTGMANFVLQSSPVSYVSYEYEDERDEYFWICDDMLSVLRNIS